MIFNEFFRICNQMLTLINDIGNIFIGHTINLYTILYFHFCFHK